MEVESNACESTVCVVYADSDIIVLDKPAGLLSVPGRGPDKQDCLSARVQARYSDARVVHRLDMATSGLIVMARGLSNQRVLSEAFASRKVAKQYEAVVKGALPVLGDAWQQIDMPIGVDWPNRPRRKIDWERGKASTTRWLALEFDARLNVTHVKLEPLTGRTHQLRIHMMAIGHPILGDHLYAPPDVVALSERLMLHAYALSFEHPTRAEALTFTAQHLKCTGEPHTER